MPSSKNYIRDYKREYATAKKRKEVASGPNGDNPKTAKDKARKKSYYARHNAQGKPTSKLSAKFWSHKVKW